MILPGLHPACERNQQVFYLMMLKLLATVLMNWDSTAVFICFYLTVQM
jgi:hypothetical protein